MYGHDWDFHCHLSISGLYSVPCRGISVLFYFHPCSPRGVSLPIRDIFRFARRTYETMLRFAIGEHDGL